MGYRFFRRIDCPKTAKIYNILTLFANNHTVSTIYWAYLIPKWPDRPNFSTWHGHQFR